MKYFFIEWQKKNKNKINENYFLKNETHQFTFWRLKTLANECEAFFG